MPALSTSQLLSALDLDLDPRSPPVNNSKAVLQVVCAWPLSSQYGPGSRVLYYVFVAACVFARKAEWLRNACLAAALLLPAVAAIHALVITSLHVNGAVDMDVYGAFQVCSIGILAAPLTVRLSRTYFYDPGRNTIFLWTGLVLAGLASLAVEFYRVTPTDCPYDNDGNTILNSVSSFPYGQANCNLVCSETTGPFSPMRSGPMNNIYVIPVPTKLTFNAAMLIAAACCIPAILSLIFTLDKILEINWKTRFGGQEERMNEPIEGTNGATLGKMKGVNNMVRFFLSVVEVPMFTGAVLALLVVGEINFFSPQVSHQTEPIASIGQWGPIAGTAIAAVGSLYLLLTDKSEGEIQTLDHDVHFIHHCNCSHNKHCPALQPNLIMRPDANHSPANQSPDGNLSDIHLRPSSEILPPPRQLTSRQPTSETGSNSRRAVAKMLTTAGNYLGTAAHNKFDMSAYNRSKAREFPEIPGEERRNRALPHIRQQHIQRRDAVLREERSRAGSSSVSLSSAAGVEDIATEVRESSPYSEPARGRSRARRDTLEVPAPTYQAHSNRSEGC